jgi:endonuclease III
MGGHGGISVSANVMPKEVSFAYEAAFSNDKNLELIIELLKFKNENINIAALVAMKNYSIADFDDGLMYIGTNFCFNHNNPKCEDCPIKDLCVGYNEDKSLIENYRT